MMDELSSIDPSQLQVSLDQTQPSTTSLVGNRSSGKSSPLRGRCVKEYEEQLQQLHHENFNLKLRVFMLEERMGKALGRGDAADIIKTNIELKVENESLKKELTEKKDLLSQASAAIDVLENEQRGLQAAHQKEQQTLLAKIEALQKDLAEIEDGAFKDRRNLLPVDESADLYAQAFGSFLSPAVSCNVPDHHSKEEVEELLQRIAELESNVEGLRTEAAVQMMSLDQIRQEAEESQNELQKFRLRVKELETEIGEQEVRIQRMQTEEIEKDARIECLTQELEVRFTELKDKEARIQTLTDDLSAKEPVIEYKVQEIVEKDKLIEEKQCQLEQQNKILVEIQITLDEKQKQIEELESSLAERKKKIEELENGLSKAGRTLQGFMSDVQKKDKDLEQLKNELKKKDKKIKDLGAELKEVKDMLNKAKWEAETSGREDNVKAMAEEENERLWAELEEKNRLLTSMEKDREQLRKDAERYQSLMMSLGQKEEALSTAEKQISVLNNKNQELAALVVNKERVVSDLEKKLAALQAISTNQSATPNSSTVSSEAQRKSKGSSRSRGKGHEGSTISEQNSLFASVSSLSAQATPHVQLPQPLLIAETSVADQSTRLGQTQSSDVNLLAEVARLKKAELEKDAEIEKLRKELVIQGQLHLVSQSPVASSASPNLHSASPNASLEGTALYQEQQALKAQLAAYSEDRKDLKRAVEQLKGQLSSLPESDAKTLRLQLQDSQSRVAQLQEELDKLKTELKNSSKSQDSRVHDSLRMYKREVAKLRKRLADSTNACDMLRIRLEEMADVLEEILHMEDQGLLNLSNWSTKRRQALQHSILQSRELSRSLSQSLMIGVDFDSIHDGPLSSSSMSASSWSVHESGNLSEQADSSRENLSAWERSSSNSLPPPTSDTKCGRESLRAAADDTDGMNRLSAELSEKERALKDQQTVIDKLRSVVTHLEEQIKQRDIEINWLNAEREKKTPSQSSLNKSVQTERAEFHKPPHLVSSTPYHPNTQKPAGPNFSSSFFSPINNVDTTTHKEATEPLCLADKALVTSAPGLLRLEDSLTNIINVSATAGQGASPKPLKAVAGVAANVPPSESDAWSEPDRSVSFARIGLSSQDPHALAPVPPNRRSRAHSATGQASESEESSDPAQNNSSYNRKSRSDGSEMKKIHCKLRIVEQENSSLRSQLSTLVGYLRTTWDANNEFTEETLEDNSENKENLRTSDDFSQKTKLSLTEEFAVEAYSFSGGNVTTAQFIIDALQNRLQKMRESLKRKETRLKESKDLITQLEFKVKEKHFKNRGNELRLKEAEDSLQQKTSLVSQLEKCIQQLEAKQAEFELLFKNKQEEWGENVRLKEKFIEELKVMIQNKEEELKKLQANSQRWEKSFSECQNSFIQLESQKEAQEKELIRTKIEHQSQVALLEKDIEGLRLEKEKLSQTADSLRVKLESADEAASKFADLKQKFTALQDELLKIQMQKSQPCPRCDKSTAEQASGGVAKESQSLRSSLEMQFYRQLSQMSDYVSDHLNEDGEEALGPGATRTASMGQQKEGAKPSLFPSPDLGIESDPSRLPSLEHAPFGPGLVSEAAWRLISNGAHESGFQGVNESEQRTVSATSPTTEEAVVGERCPNCVVLEKKYRKAKYTLAVTLEKLRVANVRREKVDKALNKELGKTHNILSQAREYLQQASNQNTNSNNGA